MKCSLSLIELGVVFLTLNSGLQGSPIKHQGSDLSQKLVDAIQDCQFTEVRGWVRVRTRVVLGLGLGMGWGLG